MMFTGLVEGIGIIRGKVSRGEGLRLGVAPPFPAAELALGESVAVSGACLTVTEVQGGVFWVDVSPETLRRTTLAAKTPGEPVNLERALRLGDRLGGHLVTGHIDGLGVLRERRPGPEHLYLRVELPEELAPLVIEKGSIAVDGVSLTVNEVKGRTFAVNIIPLTGRETTLSHLKVGDQVNLETDIIGKYVLKLLGPHLPGKGGLTPEFLARHGFI